MARFRRGWVPAPSPYSRRGEGGEEWQGGPLWSPDRPPVPVGAREVRSGRVGLYERSLRDCVARPFPLMEVDLGIEVL